VPAPFPPSGAVNLSAAPPISQGRLAETTGTAAGRAGRPAPADDLFVLRLDDLAALLLALGLARLDPALALAGVLPGARVGRAGACGLAFARVDARAVNGVPACLLGGAGDDGAAQEQPRRGARDQHSPARSVHAHPPSSLVDSDALASRPWPCQDVHASGVRPACQHGSVEQYPRDLAEIVDARDGVAVDEHQVGAFPDRDLTEVGTLAAEEARVLPGGRTQRLPRREARRDELRELQVKTGSRKVARIAGIAADEHGHARAP